MLGFGKMEVQLLYNGVQCIGVGVRNTKMISNHMWHKQDLLREKMKIKPVKTTVRQNRHTKYQNPKKKKKAHWLDQPFTKLQLNDKELESYLTSEAKKIRAEKVVMRRTIKKVFNLNSSARSLLTEKVLKTKVGLTRFIASVEKLRRLVEQNETKRL
jgi:hypothetical protein